MTSAEAMLHRLPELAAEVFLTWGHPNPTERAERRGPGSVHQVPLDLTAWDALRVDAHGQLARLSMCVRMVAEELRDAGEPWPDLANPPTWVGECGWLLLTLGWWQRQPWADDIEHEIRAAHRELSRAARVPSPLRLVCPRAGCGWPVHGQAVVGDGHPSYFQCEAGHIIDHHAEVRRLGEVQEFTSAELADLLGITRRTIKRWKQAGIVQPIGRRGQHHVYALADVKRAQEMTRRTG